MAQDKPSFKPNNIWAAGAAAVDKREPADSRTQTGWAFGENPPFWIFNWFWNKLGEYVVHTQQNGIPNWDADTEYQLGAVTIHKTKLYHSQATNTNRTPGKTVEWRLGLPTYESAQVPIGGIIAYGGKFIDIPAGWALCDGNNNTPNLTDRFIKGTKTEADVGNTGGFKNATLVEHEHSGTTNKAGVHKHKAKDNNHTMNERTTAAPGAGGDMSGNSLFIETANVHTENAGEHTHTFKTAPAGVSALGKNEPPYIVLAYIQRKS